MISSTRRGVYNFDKVLKGQSQYNYSILEIAQSLSGQSRYNAHCSPFYSVAAHSLFVQSFYNKDITELYLLMHDFHEAFTGDITSPVQKFLQCDKLKELQSSIDEDIRHFYEIPEPSDIHLRLVKKIDRLAFLIEYYNLFSENTIKQLEQANYLANWEGYAFYIKNKESLDLRFQEHLTSLQYENEVNLLSITFSSLMDKWVYKI